MWIDGEKLTRVFVFTACFCRSARRECFRDKQSIAQYALNGGAADPNTRPYQVSGRWHGFRIPFSFRDPDFAGDINYYNEYWTFIADGGW